MTHLIECIKRAHGLLVDTFSPHEEVTLEESVDVIDDNNIVILPTEPKTKKSNKTSRSEQSKSAASSPGSSQEEQCPDGWTKSQGYHHFNKL